MNSKRLLDKSPFGMRVGSASKHAGMESRADGTQGRDVSVAALDSGLIFACKNGPATGSVFYTFVLDDGSLRECTREDIVLNGKELSSDREKQHDMKKVGDTSSRSMQRFFS